MTTLGGPTEDGGWRTTSCFASPPTFWPQPASALRRVGGWVSLTCVYGGSVSPKGRKSIYRTLRGSAYGTYFDLVPFARLKPECQRGFIKLVHAGHLDNSLVGTQQRLVLFYFLFLVQGHRDRNYSFKTIFKSVNCLCHAPICRRKHRKGSNRRRGIYLTQFIYKMLFGRANKTN